MKAPILNRTLKASPAIHRRILESEERPVACKRVGGAVVTGKADGPGPGEDHSETDEGHEWSKTTGQAAAANPFAVAEALAGAPVPPPPSES